MNGALVVPGVSAAFRPRFSCIIPPLFRFIPPPNLLTEAVFVVDDDIAVPCDHLLAAFGVSHACG